MSKITLQKDSDTPTILSYHSVDEKNPNILRSAINPNEFIKQMNYLRDNYKIVSLDDIRRFVVEGYNLPRRSVAITFDDGFYDNYLNVYPYFKKHRLPATIFITTGYTGGIFTPLGLVSLKMLGWNEIREMSQNNIEIGAHTVTHPNLVKIDIDNSKSEVLGSKEEIEKQIGKNCKYFAYPFNACNKEVVELVNILGFKGGVNGEGIICRGDNSFVLKRIQIDSSVSFMMFKVSLTKAKDWYLETKRVLVTIKRKCGHV